MISNSQPEFRGVGMIGFPLAPCAGRARLKKCIRPGPKKCIWILALIVPVFALAGCSSQGRRNSQPQPPTQTQPGNLLGRWQGYYDGAAITITFEANGHYSQLVQGPSVTTTQSGPYTLATPNTVSMRVSDWTPRMEHVYHNVGASHGYWSSRRALKPPDFSDTYAFSGPNTLVLTDQAAQGSITMKRLP
jgi:hypothetical protein